MPKNDFTFKVNGIRLPRAQFCFLKKKKKETGTVEDDFTCNVVLDPILQKKKFN